MTEVWILLALLGLPLLPFEVAVNLVAVSVCVLGAVLLGIGCWALADHRWPSAERRQAAEPTPSRAYRGKRRRPVRLLLRPGSPPATDLNRQATSEATRQLAEQDPDDEGGLPLVTWRIEEGSRNG